jgi:hypothetical protein
LGSGLPSFTPDCSCPALLKYQSWRSMRVSYPAVTVYGDAFQASSDTHLSTSAIRQYHLTGLTTPDPQGLPALTRIEFRLLPVRSPLLRGYFRFLGVLRCFNSPGALRRWTVTSQCSLGCPIRKSWDQRLLTAPPRLSQLCHVLHRHAAPRHPPYAHSVFPEERPIVNARRNRFFCVCNAMYL